MTAFLIIRSTVPEEHRAALDTWYETEHLPDALKAFKPVSARRGWSDSEPGVHVAMIEFDTIETARATVGGDVPDPIKGMIAEYDRVWQGRVTRTRELVGITQKLEP